MFSVNELATLLVAQESPEQKAVSEQIDNLNGILKASASSDPTEQQTADRQLAKAIELPIRKGVMSGDILGNIFEPNMLGPGVTPVYPLDLLTPGEENDYIAFTMPKHGYIPQRAVEADEVTIITYPIANAIDWNLALTRDARWDMISRALEVFYGGFTKKLNDDGYHTILGAAKARNIVVSDSDASGGVFSKKLVSLMKTTMKRGGGGNTSSVDVRKLTDLFVSVEALEDIRNWGVDQIDEVTRREIFVSENESGVFRLFGVNVRELTELGEGMEYELYYESTLSGSLPSGKVEIVIGLDLARNDSFVMPVRQDIVVKPDPTLERQLRQGFYGHLECGFGVLDARNVLLGAL